jgi:hypothetical protein
MDMENLPEIQITSSPSGKTKYYNVVFESGTIISCRSLKQAEALRFEFQCVLRQKQELSTGEHGFDNCSSDNESDRTGDSWRSAYQEASSSLSGIRDAQRRSDYCQRELREQVSSSREQVRTIGKLIQESSAIYREMAQTVTELAHVWHQSKIGSSDRLSGIQQSLEPTTINVAAMSATYIDDKT